MRQALYRRYRPQTFSGMVGQEYIKTALKNQVKTGDFGHAYLFAGPKGTGKTTTARILAKAINCLDLQDGEPCGKCANCLAHDNGTMVDLIEIDAASNRGIDDIRDLVSKIHLAPSMGSYKVYVLDEAHMLTTEASNALLKTLEEPPAHVVFVLATTQPESLKPTILSRCQRFDFKPVNADDVAKYLQEVSAAEKITITQDALELIAELSHGGMRDALSLLDQAAFMGEEITGEKLSQWLGFASVESALKLTEMVTKGKAAEALQLVSDLYHQGYDLGKFTVQWMNLLRQVLTISLGGRASGEMGEEQRQRIQNLTRLPQAEIWQMVETLIEAHQRMRSAALPALPLEVAIAKLSAKFATGKSTSEIKIADTSPKAEAPKEEPAVTPEPEKVEVQSQVKAAVGTEAGELLGELVAYIRAKSPTLAGVLSRSKLELADGTAILKFAQSFHKEAVERNGNIPHIKEFFSTRVGEVELHCIFDPALQGENKGVSIDNVTEVFGSI